jgi:hypothetical protein
LVNSDPVKSLLLCLPVTSQHFFASERPDNPANRLQLPAIQSPDADSFAWFRIAAD